MSQPFNFPAACLVPPLTECPCQMAALVRTIRRAILSLSTKWRHAMAKVKQLTVALENRPGTLAHMAKVLADAKVNIVALLNSTAGAQGSAQVVVDNVNSQEGSGRGGPSIHRRHAGAD